ncbi:uncharacterized protein BO88DRAFT_421641 [Aspergillus vadensis CBS 113365]|uniref:Altered inheritance of mitochondria protein 9, mitochondrial n=1 Tax=Aspergillus vadensis (strain CBS 113365 / IMI 142717 / IBT 24658) TaxID=1448311 RepID=A0A319BLM8_ASPVC|nr:hypothetical protein BO88DRAFT_421641 [Aspergillus vadensis CBS 113365]PYH73234.1 hypothetical protein BO88DRAFT_421641 [Aspergillus vadensis CBS 113365]
MTCDSEPDSQNDDSYKSQPKLFYRSTDRGVWSIRSKLVLKDRGNDIPSDEASNIRLVENRTSIPPLSTAWQKLAAEQRENIAKQTADYLLRLRELQSDCGLPLDGLQGFCPRGPCTSDEELWKEMDGALHESVPEAVRRLLRRLSYVNIMVKDGSVTGIIDWETAAYMPVWRESLCVSFSGCEEDEEWGMLLRNYMPDHYAYHYLCLYPNIWAKHFIDEAERKPISRDELFAYTNGHFLVNEEHQLAQRDVKFNVDALCSVAAALGDVPSPVASVDKMEGGFSKALLIRKENGSEVVAKIPCQIAGPARLTTASEVGVLEYLRRNTTIPIPRVLSWSSDRANSVGVEYIVMEKATGVPLFRVWGDMTESEKLQLIQNVTKLEAQLSAIRFPAYGGLYLRDHLKKSEYQCLLLDDNVDPSQSSCIGPSPDRSFDTQSAEQPTSANKPINRSPWTTVSGLGIAIAERELSRIARMPPNKPSMFNHDTHPLLGQSAQPTLWHTDLHMGNIYVAPDDRTRIVSVIDFQSISVMPLFLQSRWPEFLKPPDNYTKGFTSPELPGGYDNMDDESKMLARREWSQAKLAKAYEVSTYLENRPAHTARNVPRVFRELFTRCGEVSEMGVIPLRACLIEIFQNWSNLGFTGSCPYSFTEEEIQTHERQFAEYQAWHDVQHLAQECLDTDAEGWISPELNMEDKRRQNRELLAMFIERMAGEKSPEEARQMWPFPDDA